MGPVTVDSGEVERARRDERGFLSGQGWRCLKGDGELQVSSWIQRVAAGGFDVLDPAEDPLADHRRRWSPPLRKISY
jgi:hypothetical protein